MVNLKKDVHKNIEELERSIKQAEDFLSGAPEGCLKYQQRNENPLFYHQYIEKDTGMKKRKYIKKQDLDFAQILAQKGYMARLQPILKEELEALKKFEKNYHPEKKEQVFSELVGTRKAMVNPLYLGVEEQVRQWKEEEVPVYAAHPENLRFETDRGEMVRSKSELILANLFARYSDTIWYKYEQPLELYDRGELRIVHPDFTLLNLRTGKIVYWEHAGCMDDVRYVEQFIRKVNLYVLNHIMPGEGLIITYETYAKPLDIGIVKILIQNVMV